MLAAFLVSLINLLITAYGPAIVAAATAAIGAFVYKAFKLFGLKLNASQLAQLDGTTAWSILVEATDPALVSLQLDLVAMLAAGDRLTIEFARGEADARVEQTRPGGKDGA